MTNRNQITYFFGAGASYNAIPTIDGLYNRINNLIEYLNKIKGTLEGGNPESLLSEKIIRNKETLLNIIAELEWLNKESKNRHTIDNLAKVYHLNEDETSLCRLKRGLMIYFFFEQNISFPNYSQSPNDQEDLVDKRYDHLIANIAERSINGIKFKEHIKLITWNYDLQIDLAIKSLFPSKFQTINRIKNEKNIHPNQNSYDKSVASLIENFAAIKLNGNAFFDNNFDNIGHGGKTIHDYIFDINESENTDVLGEFLDKYSEIFPRGVNTNHAVYKYFNYAWEKENKYTGHKKLIEEAAKIMEATKILIIVGYSFPFPNLEIDKQLFAKCNPQEIIIQDKYPEKIKKEVLKLLPQNTTPFDENRITLVEPDKTFPMHPET
jgi:hypothetical protein